MENKQTRTILIVEDETDLRALVSMALTKAGFRVLQAADAIQAFLVWKQERANIHLLIADIMMPGMTGPEVALEFRAERPDLPIIFMSGNVRESVQETSHTVRAAKFILKPF